jgi:hippurate hydrolase
VATAHGLDVDAQHLPEYPATVNHPEHVDFAAGVVADVFGADRYQPMEFPQPGSEDFSRVLQAVPGTYLMLGAAVEDPEKAPSNHSPRARFDDGVLTAGAVLHAELATRALAELATGTRVD